MVGKLHLLHQRLQINCNFSHCFLVLFCFERNGFPLQENATMIRAGTLKVAVLRGDWANDNPESENKDKDK